MRNRHPSSDSAILFLYGADHSRRAINFHERTVFPQRSCVLYSCNARQPILSRDKCPMLEESADLEDNASLVRGRIKVLHSPDEKPLEKGEILVARATDPGWTPLFVNAAPTTLEIGGLLQHGALVAREYGLPCVAGIENATSLWKDGTLVEIDGSAGVIRTIQE